MEIENKSKDENLVKYIDENGKDYYSNGGKERYINQRGLKNNLIQIKL